MWSIIRQLFAATSHFFKMFIDVVYPYPYVKGASSFESLGEPAAFTYVSRNLIRRNKRHLGNNAKIQFIHDSSTDHPVQTAVTFPIRIMSLSTACSMNAIMFFITFRDSGLLAILHKVFCKISRFDRDLKVFSKHKFMF